MLRRKRSRKPILRGSEVIIHRCIWVKQHRLLQSVNYFPGCLNSLESILDYSKSTLCPPACVCLEPLALVVLFTQWTAPASCFLRRGWVQVTAAACISTHLVPLLFMPPSPLHSPSMEFTSTRCDVSAWLTHCSTFKWYHSHIKPFILVFLFLWEIQLWIKGVLALVWILPGEGWDERAEKIVFELKTKQRKQNQNNNHSQH